MLVVIDSFIAAIFLRYLWREKQLKLDVIDLAALGIVIYIGETIFWSSDWMTGVHQYIHALALMFLFFWGRHCELPRLDIIAAILVTMTVAMAYIDPISIGGQGNVNFGTELILVMLPFAIMAPFGLIVATAAVIHLIWFNPSQLEFFVAFMLIAGWAFHKRPIYGFILLGMVGILSYLIAPSSLEVRAEIWINSLYAWWEAPWFGHGFGSFSYAYQPFREAHLPYLDGRLLMAPSFYAGAAHNEVIQTLVEFGVVGTSIFAGVLWWALRGRKWASSAGMTLVIFAVLELIEFPLHNPATAAIGMLMLGHLTAGLPSGFSRPSWFSRLSLG